MGIFSFLKKFVKEKEVDEIVIEKLAFSEIDGWLEKKNKENEIKERKIISVIEEKIKDFINELRKKIIILSEFDVKSKKAEEKFKGIVIDSREKYIELVEDLIEKLDNLEETKLERLIERVNKIFFNFSKASFKNYEKTTILIGKEMASIKESLKVFSKDLLKIFDENKFLIDFFDNTLIIREKLDTIISISKNLKKISEKKSNLNKEISEKEKKSRILKQNLEEIKISPDYLENLAKHRKIESLREESKKEILELKQLLDFKALASFFHINPEQMKMVKNHREDFYTHFIRNNGKLIMNLLNESKLNDDKIIEKIKRINSKLEEIKNHQKEIKKDETQELYYKIKEITVEIDNLKIERVKEEKRAERLRTNKEDLIIFLRQELGKMNVDVIK